LSSGKNEYFYPFNDIYFMHNSSLATSILHYTDFSDSELKLIMEKFRLIKIRKKTNILEAGKIAEEVYLIAKGCLRMYYEHEGNDISAFFFTEGMFGGAYDSFISRQACRHAVETLEDCELYTITYNDLQYLFTNLPKTNEFVRKILEERFVTLHKLFTAQILDSPEERYANLMKERPDLINRIPQHQLATFLGITPVSLSRIRNRIVRK